MAKDRDSLAADLDTESTSGFLAEEDAFDRRMLWRLGSWGAAAVGAVTIAVMANQSALTMRRDLVAASDIARQAQQLQTLAKESHNETRRLASAIDTLNGVRDRHDRKAAGRTCAGTASLGGGPRHTADLRQYGVRRRTSRCHRRNHAACRIGQAGHARQGTGSHRQQAATNRKARCCGRQACNG